MSVCVCGGGGGVETNLSTFLCMQLMLIRCELSLCLLNRQDGSGNQCCYEQDGNLLYAADTYQGSTPDRSHDWGSMPYGAPYHVPSLSHWTHDVITFYYCCLWVEYRECNYYMDRRATRDCKAYTPPHSGKHDCKASTPPH